MPTALAEAVRLIVPLLVNETVLVAPPLALWKKAESIMAKAEAVFVPIAVATAPKLMEPELVMVAVALICAPWLAVANWEMPLLIVAKAKASSLAALARALTITLNVPELVKVTEAVSPWAYWWAT